MLTSPILWKIRSAHITAQCSTYGDLPNLLENRYTALDNALPRLVAAVGVGTCWNAQIYLPSYPVQERGPQFPLNLHTATAVKKFAFCDSIGIWRFLNLRLQMQQRGKLPGHLSYPSMLPAQGKKHVHEHFSKGFVAAMLLQRPDARLSVEILPMSRPSRHV